MSDVNFLLLGVGEVEMICRVAPEYIEFLRLVLAEPSSGKEEEGAKILFNLHFQLSSVVQDYIHIIHALEIYSSVSSKTYRLGGAVKPSTAECLFHLVERIVAIAEKHAWLDGRSQASRPAGWHYKALVANWPAIRGELSGLKWPRKSQLDSCRAEVLREFSKAKRRCEVEQSRRTRLAMEEPGQDATQPTMPPKPRILRTGWREIMATLEMTYKDRDKVKSVNDRFQGPIKTSGQGGQPMVYQCELIDWWNKLASHQQDLANQREGAKLSAEAQQSYSRDGTAAPEIGGGVKKRRRDKRS